MTYLLDTTTLSELMREHPRVQQRMVCLANTDRVATCAIARGEIRYGIERLAPGQRQRDLEIKATRIFAAIDCEPVHETAADYYARVKVDCQTKGLPLDENDLWIAATALALGATLVSKDSDFRAVSGLTVEDWTK